MTEAARYLPMNRTELIAECERLRDALRPIVETAQSHPAMANFMAVRRQLIGAARWVLEYPTQGTEVKQS